MTGDLSSPANSSSFDDPRPDETFTLKDGRTLGYGEWGDRAGEPLFHFHSYPASRLEAVLVHEAALKAGARLICIDRPSMGLSTFKPDRRLLDWPDDVLELAGALDLDRFAVVGMSGGGPYAAACAYKIPDRLTACGIIAGLTSLDHGKRDMTLQIRLVFWVARHLPGLFEAVLGWLVNSYRQNPGKMEQLLLRFLYDLPEPDRRLVERPEIRASIIRHMEESFRQSAKGPAYEAGLYTRSWGFDPEQIAFNRVNLWHGDLDRSVPVSMAQRMARRIPQVRATFYPNDGHLSVALNHMDEILETVIGNLGSGARDR